jgi:hypothetical protein
MSKDEVSNEKREESNDRRGGDGDISEEFFHVSLIAPSIEVL